MQVTTESQEPTTYWLLTWLESQGISTSAQAAAILNRPSTLRELRDVAEQWSSSVETPPLGLNLVAGAGLRLDDDLSCPSAGCRRQQVDVLFRHAWHYYDRVLLPDGVGRLVQHPPQGWGAEYLRDVLVGLIDVVLHIQHLGASSLVHYYSPTQSSSLVVDEALDEGLADQQDRWDDAWNDVEAILIAEGSYEFESLGEGEFQVTYSDPLLAIGSKFDIKLDEGEPEAEEFLRRAAAHEIMHGHMVELESDLVAARLLRGPLGSTVWSHERVLSHLSKYPDTSNVLFRVAFPSLEHVPIKELISIRATEGDAFLAFREALTKAVGEMVANNRASDPQAVADEILRDVVEPELAKLRRRLYSARRALIRKAATSLGLAGVSTLCGLQFGANAALAASAGVALLLPGMGTAASKYWDEKQTVEISDMFFLWKALQHAE